VLREAPPRGAQAPLRAEALERREGVRCVARAALRAVLRGGGPRRGELHLPCERLGVARGTPLRQEAQPDRAVPGPPPRLGGGPARRALRPRLPERPARDGARRGRARERLVA